MSTLWPPAAAISSARFASRCPLTSAMSPCGSTGGRVRGREVGGEPLERELEPRVEHRGAHALAGLAHGAVGQSDDGERREAAAEVDLDRDLPGGDSLDGECGDAREHASKLDRAAAHV